MGINRRYLKAGAYLVMDLHTGELSVVTRYRR